MTAIESLAVGDTVHTRSDTDYTDHLNPISALMRREAPGHYEIEVGNETVKVTSEHPFWRQGSGWTEAKDLQPGDPVAAASGDVVVLSSRYVKGPVSVYNFSVERNHNYFVSPHKLWVHNQNGPCSLDSPAALKGKVDALVAKVPADKRQKLGELLDSDKKLKDAFIDNPKLVDGWLLVSDHPKISSNLGALETVTDLVGDSDFIGKLPGGQEDLKKIIGAMKNPLEGTENHKLVDFQKHLRNVSDITKRHSDVQGFNRLLTDLENGNYSMQDGVTHMMEQMAKIDAGKVKKIDYEFEGDGVECVKCRYDLLVEVGGTEVKVEYKSWSAGNISKISSRQFTEYFRSSETINEFQYVFNKSKTPDLSVVKKEMKKVFEKNFDSIYDSMNEGMRQSLGLFDDPDISAKDAFRSLVENTDSDLYKFIKVE